MKATRTGAAVSTAFLMLVVMGTAQEPAQRKGGADSTRKVPTSPEAEAVRKVAERFAEAFNKRDLEAMSGLFDPQARVVDEDGQALEGIEDIRQRFAIAFEANPNLKVDFQTDNIRFITPEVAVEEGRARAIEGRSESITSGMHTVIYVKRDGAWKILAVRDQPSVGDEANRPRAHLEELAWMVGEWVDESDGGVVKTSCAWSEDGNYLLRSFTVHIDGKRTMNGTQRIGWDAQREQIRSWVFDSDGGFAEGMWTRGADNQWIIKATGTTAAGDTVTATNIITREHPDTMRWQSVDRTMAGEALPDGEEYIIARKPPAPAGAGATNASAKPSR